MHTHFPARVTRRWRIAMRDGHALQVSDVIRIDATSYRVIALTKSDEYPAALIGHIGQPLVIAPRRGFECDLLNIADGGGTSWMLLDNNSDNPVELLAAVGCTDRRPLVFRRQLPGESGVRTDAWRLAQQGDESLRDLLAELDAEDDPTLARLVITILIAARAAGAEYPSRERIERVLCYA